MSQSFKRTLAAAALLHAAILVGPVSGSRGYSRPNPFQSISAKPGSDESSKDGADSGLAPISNAPLASEYTLKESRRSLVAQAKDDMDSGSFNAGRFMIQSEYLDALGQGRFFDPDKAEAAYSELLAKQDSLIADGESVIDAAKKSIEDIEPVKSDDSRISSALIDNSASEAQITKLLFSLAHDSAPKIAKNLYLSKSLDPLDAVEDKDKTHAYWTYGWTSVDIRSGKRLEGKPHHGTVYDLVLDYAGSHDIDLFGTKRKIAGAALALGAGALILSARKRKEDEDRTQGSSEMMDPAAIEKMKKALGERALEDLWIGKLQMGHFLIDECHIGSLEDGKPFDKEEAKRIYGERLSSLKRLLDRGVPLVKAIPKVLRWNHYWLFSSEISDPLLNRCGNCRANSLLVASLAYDAGIKSVRLVSYKGHLTAMVCHEGQDRDLVSGSKLVEGGTVFSPEDLVHDYHRHGSISFPISDARFPAPWILFGFFGIGAFMPWEPKALRSIYHKAPVLFNAIDLVSKALLIPALVAACFSGSRGCIAGRIRPDADAQSLGSAAPSGPEIAQGMAGSDSRHGHEEAMIKRELTPREELSRIIERMDDLVSSLDGTGSRPASIDCNGPDKKAKSPLSGITFDIDTSAEGASKKESADDAPYGYYRDSLRGNLESLQRAMSETESLQARGKLDDSLSVIAYGQLALYHDISIEQMRKLGYHEMAKEAAIRRSDARSKGSHIIRHWGRHEREAFWKAHRDIVPKYHSPSYWSPHGAYLMHLGKEGEDLVLDPDTLDGHHLALLRLLADTRTSERAVKAFTSLSYQNRYDLATSFRNDFRLVTRTDGTDEEFCRAFIATFYSMNIMTGPFSYTLSSIRRIISQNNLPAGYEAPMMADRAWEVWNHSGSATESSLRYVEVGRIDKDNDCHARNDFADSMASWADSAEGLFGWRSYKSDPGDRGSADLPPAKILSLYNLLRIPYDCDRSWKPMTIWDQTYRDTMMLAK